MTSPCFCLDLLLTFSFERPVSVTPSIPFCENVVEAWHIWNPTCVMLSGHSKLVGLRSGMPASGGQSELVGTQSYNNVVVSINKGTQ